MRIFVKRENWEDGIWMRLPAAKEEAEQVRKRLEEQHSSIMLPFIGAVDSKFPELENRLVGEIVFPAKNLGRLNQMAERLGSLNGEEEIPERVEIFTSIDGLLEHLPPCSTLEELNQAAKVIEEMETCSGIDWKLTFAALEAELPGTMEECCRIIQNHQTYELLPFPFLVPESYAHYYLEQKGFSIPEGLKDHFDYRRYGQEKIWETGAAETFYGVVVNREHPICLDHGERQELKLYSPLTLTTFAGYPLFPALLHGEKMPAFKTVIRKEIAKSMREYGAGGLAETLYNQLLSGKVSTIVPDVEEHQGQLWGVAQICTKGELTERELAGLKEEWKEIAAHGWGDLFASRILEAGHIRFHAGFWDMERGENLSLMTEEEFGREVGGFEIRM